MVETSLHKKLKWSKQTGESVEKKSHYKDAKPKVFSNSLPEGWVAGYVIVEGMIMVNTTPLGNHRTFADYANFLGKRFLTPHFSAGSKEVHLFLIIPKGLHKHQNILNKKDETLLLR